MGQLRSEWGLGAVMVQSRGEIAMCFVHLIVATATASAVPRSDIDFGAIPLFYEWEWA